MKSAECTPISKADDLALETRASKARIRYR